MSSRRLQKLIAAALACAMGVGAPPIALAQTEGPAMPLATPPDKSLLKQGELDQLLAPIALYPDSLLTQIFMASTYPLEVVQADRWARDHKDLNGDVLAKELENQSWDPSVKSLVNFPDVLGMMNDKLDLTIKLGNAFLEQQADVMNTVQRLRSKAQEAGNLKSNEQQTIIIEAAPPVQATQTIIVQQTPPPAQLITIESPSPAVIYVPAYNPVVVYGVWAYPGYPPYPYYPPRPPYYVATAGVYFGVGVACGVAWGYAWGRCSWGRTTININVNQNVNYNRTINRNSYQANVNKNTTINGGGGSWQHNPAHRKGVAYPNKQTAQQFGGANQSAQATVAREAYRGRTDTGSNQIVRGGADSGNAGTSANRPRPTAQQNNSPAQSRGGGAGQDRSGASRGNAFDGADGTGSAARSASQRGQSSRSAAGSRSGAAGGGGGAGGGGSAGGGRGQR